MTFEQYFKEIMKINPIKDNQSVVMSKKQFKAILEQTWDIATDNERRDPVDWLFGRN